MKSLFDEFEVVASESERNFAFHELAASSTPIITASADGLTFAYTLSKFENNFLVLAPMQNAPLAAANVYLIFSVSTGQFLMRGPLKAAREGYAVFNSTTELRRLQRRKNFRVSVQNLSSVKLEIGGVSHIVTDIGAGGLSAVVSNQGVLGQNVTCTLRHPMRSILDLHGVIRHIDPAPQKQEKWGIEFETLSADEMQQLIALSLQLNREKII